jgi:C4-dicarboxylate-binding protein DctP
MLTMACVGGGGTQSAPEGTPSLQATATYTNPGPPFYNGVVIQNVFDETSHRTAGRMTFKIYPGGQLYQTPDDLQAVIQGNVNLAVMNTTTFDSIVPAAQVFDLPYIFSNTSPDIYNKLVGTDSVLAKDLDKQAQAKGFKLIGGWIVSPLQLYSRSNIDGPDALKGKKVRVPVLSPIIQALASTLGYTPVALSPVDTTTALRQGVIDGVWGTTNFFSTFPDAAKYVIDTGPQLIVAQAVIANLAWWKSLPTSYQDALTQSTRDVSSTEYGIETAAAIAAHTTLANSGHTFLAFTPAQVKQMQTLTNPVYDRFRSQIGAQDVEYVTTQRNSL